MTKGKSITNTSAVAEERYFWQARYGDRKPWDWPKAAEMFPSTVPGNRGACSPLGGQAIPAGEGKKRK
jgi:hypothetical protein